MVRGQWAIGMSCLAATAATTLGGSPACPGDCAQPLDKQVDTIDFLILLSQWSSVGTSCDIGAPGVGVEDFLALLEFWGPCPVPDHDECVAATPLSRAEPGPMTVPFDMVGATASGEAYQCVTGEAVHKDMWYCLANDGPGPKLVTLSTDLTLAIEVYAGCGCPPGGLLACLPGSGNDRFEMQPGEEVLIRLINHLDLPNDQLAGTLTIHNDLVPPPPPNIAFYFDPVEFATAAGDADMVQKLTWDFTPNDLPQFAGVLLDDPLNLLTHVGDPDDPWGVLWPPDVDNVQFQSNMSPAPVPPLPRGTDGLALLAPGFVPELGSYALIANVFTDAFNVISGPPANDLHAALSMTMVGLGIEGPVPVVIRVTVLNFAGAQIGQAEVPGTAGEEIFVGVLAHNGVIPRRIELRELLGDGAVGGAEGITSITAWEQGPFCDDCNDGVLDACGAAGCRVCETMAGDCQCVASALCEDLAACPDGSCPPGFFCCVDNCCGDEPMCVPACGP